MKVLFLSSYSTEGCGVSKYAEELMNGLKNNKVNVLSNRIYFYKQKLGNIFSLIKIIFNILNQKPKIVHIQYTPPICGPFIIPFLFFLNFLDSPKIILTAHEKPDGYLDHIKNKILKKAFFLYEKNVFRHVNRILVHTLEHKQQLISKYKIKEEKIKVISHGIDKKIKVINSQIQEIKKKYDIKEEKIITFFGTIRPNKGIEYLILSFSNIVKKRNNLILVVAGSAPRIKSKYFDNLKNLTIKLGIEDHVRFTGFVEDEDIPKILQISKIVVLPYIQITQSGVLYREVIPYNKPVIVTNVGGIGETIRRYNIGISVDPKNSELLANAISDLLTNEKKMKTIRNNMSKIKNKFSWDSIAKLHIKIYHEVIFSV